MRNDEFVEKSKEESRKESKDYKKFSYHKLDKVPNLFGSKESSTSKSPKSTELHLMQPESQFEGFKL